MNVHLFETTSEAYNASQWRDDIADGDVLLVASERVAGVLCLAWPIAVSDKRGAFHGLKPGSSWSDLEGRDYSASHALALEALAAAS